MLKQQKGLGSRTVTLHTFVDQLVRFSHYYSALQLFNSTVLPSDIVSPKQLEPLLTWVSSLRVLYVNVVVGLCVVCQRAVGL